MQCDRNITHLIPQSRVTVPQSEAIANNEFSEYNVTQFSVPQHVSER